MDPVHKLSMIPRGVGALGYTMQRPTEDRFLRPQSDEVLVFNEATTRAALRSRRRQPSCTGTAGSSTTGQGR
jgi:ATP-dependent Zn protease